MDNIRRSAPRIILASAAVFAILMFLLHRVTDYTPRHEILTLSDGWEAVVQGRTVKTDVLSELSEKYGFKLIVVKKKQEEHRDICSSDIKVLLSEGNISKVNKLLGYPYFAIGRVEHGKKLGRTIGFPTANLFVEGNKLLPPNGVYATVLKADGKEYRAVTNIGFNPTTDDDGRIKIETYAIDVGLDLYDRIIEIAFLGFIRTERKFESLPELVEQMKRDVEVRKKLK